MAQAMQSPAYVQSSADPSINEETGGKKSLFGKIKNKTRDGTKKLKTRLNPGSPGNSNEGQVTYTGSEDEAETPKPLAHNTDDNEFQAPAAGQVPISENDPSTNMGGIFSKGKFEPQSDQTDLSKNIKPQDDHGDLSKNIEPQDDQADLSKEFAGLSTTDTGESTAQEPTGDPEIPLENNEEQKPLTENISEDHDSASKNVATDASVGVPDPTANVSGKSENPGKSWSQWAAEKVGYGKDNVAPTTTSTPSSPAETGTLENETPAEGKTVTQRAYDAAIQAKDTIHQQAVKPVYEKITGAKSDIVDDKSAATAESTQSSDPAQQSYMQKATSGLYAAKDSILTSTHPGDDDRALSQKVTETVGNLPATIKSTLGFGAKSPTSSAPTTNSESTQTTSDTSEGASPQSPGIVSRFSSLLGVVKKPGSPSQSETTADVKTPEESQDIKMSEAPAE